MTVRADEIRDLFLFEGLADWQREWIAQRAEARAFPAGTPVYQAACDHATGLPVEVSPATECEDCVRAGTRWLHLRRCLGCQHVGCCDSSPMKHASAHWSATGHPVAGSAERDEHWAWCYQDQLMLVPTG